MLMNSATTAQRTVEQQALHPAAANSGVGQVPTQTMGFNAGIMSGGRATVYTSGDGSAEWVHAGRFAGANKGKTLLFSEWSTAWDVYMTVLTASSSDATLAAHLAKHFQLVQDLQKAGRQWRFLKVH